MKEKKGIANKFQKKSNPNGGNVAGRNSKSLVFGFFWDFYKSLLNQVEHTVAH
jgi:hypothetical protein